MSLQLCRTEPTPHHFLHLRCTKISGKCTLILLSGLFLYSCKLIYLYDLYKLIVPIKLFSILICLVHVGLYTSTFHPCMLQIDVHQKSIGLIQSSVEVKLDSLPCQWHNVAQTYTRHTIKAYHWGLVFIICFSFVSNFTKNTYTSQLIIPRVSEVIMFSPRVFVCDFVSVFITMFVRTIELWRTGATQTIFCRYIVGDV